MYSSLLVHRMKFFGRLDAQVVSGPRSLETNGSRGSGNVSLVDDRNKSVGCEVEGKFAADIDWWILVVFRVHHMDVLKLETNNSTFWLALCLLKLIPQSSEKKALLKETAL